MTEKLTGLPRPSFHPAYWIIGFIVLTILVLVALRIGGYLPRSRNELYPSPSIETSSRAYVPLGVLDSKVFYFDRSDQKIGVCENNKCKDSGAIPSVESAIISPDLKKIAILSTKEAPKSGVYLIDVSIPDQTTPKYIVKAEWLPTGYSFQANSSIYWSQESKQLAFVAYKDAHADIFVYPIQSAVSQSSTIPIPPATSTPSKQAKSDQEIKRIEPIRNPGSQVGAIIWRGEQFLIFVTDVDGKDEMYEVGNNGGGIVRIKPN